ncbi:Transcription factor bHLH110 [Linum perenne]
MDESSPNLHHQVAGSSSSSSSSSSQPSSSTIRTAAHTNNNNNLYGSSAGSRGGGDHVWTQDFTFCNPVNQQELSFQWNSSSGRFNQGIKDEEGSSLSSSTSSDPFPRFTDMLISNSPSSANTTTDDTSSSSSSAFPFGYPSNQHYQFLPFSTPSFDNYGNTRASSSSSSTSLIYPSINVSSLSNQTGAPPLDVNMQALDQNLLFGSLLRDHHQTVSPYAAVDLMPQYSSPTTKISSTAATSLFPAPCDKETVAAVPEREVKRCNNQPSTTKQQASGANKKSKVDQPRSSCPPFKVRKEKLGDRITALQQLVAPFGKTDTASVLMEAIGYINFLQNQVELSVPYMKSTRNKPPHQHQPMHFQGEGGNNGDECRDLRSRGLCLVPLSCMSYIANIDAGSSSFSGAMWPPPPPHFGGGT